MKQEICLCGLCDFPEYCRLSLLLKMARTKQPAVAKAAHPTTAPKEPKSHPVVPAAPKKPRAPAPKKVSCLIEREKKVGRKFRDEKGKLKKIYSGLVEQLKYGARKVENVDFDDFDDDRFVVRFVGMKKNDKDVRLPKNLDKNLEAYLTALINKNQQPDFSMGLKTVKSMPDKDKDGVRSGMAMIYAADVDIIYDDEDDGGEDDGMDTDEGDGSNSNANSPVVAAANATVAPEDQH